MNENIKFLFNNTIYNINWKEQNNILNEIKELIPELENKEFKIYDTENSLEINLENVSFDENNIYELKKTDNNINLIDFGILENDLDDLLNILDSKKYFTIILIHNNQINSVLIENSLISNLHLFDLFIINNPTNNINFKMNTLNIFKNNFKIKEYAFKNNENLSKIILHMQKKIIDGFSNNFQKFKEFNKFISDVNLDLKSKFNSAKIDTLVKINLFIFINHKYMLELFNKSNIISSNEIYILLKNKSKNIEFNINEIKMIYILNMLYFLKFWNFLEDDVYTEKIAFCDLFKKEVLKYFCYFINNKYNLFIFLNKLKLKNYNNISCLDDNSILNDIKIKNKNILKRPNSPKITNDKEIFRLIKTFNFNISQNETFEGLFKEKNSFIWGAFNLYYSNKDQNDLKDSLFALLESIETTSYDDEDNKNQAIYIKEFKINKSISQNDFEINNKLSKNDKLLSLNENDNKNFSDSNVSKNEIDEKKEKAYKNNSIKLKITSIEEGEEYAEKLNICFNMEIINDFINYLKTYDCSDNNDNKKFINYLNFNQIESIILIEFIWKNNEQKEKLNDILITFKYVEEDKTFELFKKKVINLIEEVMCNFLEKSVKLEDFNSVLIINYFNNYKNNSNKSWLKEKLIKSLKTQKMNDKLNKIQSDNDSYNPIIRVLKHRESTINSSKLNNHIIYKIYKTDLNYFKNINKKDNDILKIKNISINTVEKNYIESQTDISVLYKTNENRMYVKNYEDLLNNNLIIFLNNILKECQNCKDLNSEELELLDRSISDIENLIDYHLDRFVYQMLKIKYLDDKKKYIKEFLESNYANNNSEKNYSVMSPNRKIRNVLYQFLFSLLIFISEEKSWIFNGVVNTITVLYWQDNILLKSFVELFLVTGILIRKYITI